MGSDTSGRTDGGLEQMQQQSTATAHRSPRLTATAPPISPAVCASAPWSVVALEIFPIGYRLRVSFYDGVTGDVDMSRLIHSPQAGVFAPLADKEQFARAFISHGVVTWPPEGDGPDLAPDAMHEAIMRTGEWIL
jgi:hypothetical protein